MIKTEPTTGGKCTESSICLAQESYRRSNLGKWKVKYEDGISYCFFCKSDLKARMYIEGIRTK